VSVKPGLAQRPLRGMGTPAVDNFNDLLTVTKTKGVQQVCHSEATVNNLRKLSTAGVPFPLKGRCPLLITLI